MNKIEIEKINNGYIISWEEEFADGTYNTQVFETKDSDKDTLTELFYFIAEHFGAHYDKFGSENLNIKWNKKGTKCE